jgi:hypothetical protein
MIARSDHAAHFKSSLRAQRSNPASGLVNGLLRRFAPHNDKGRTIGGGKHDRVFDNAGISRPGRDRGLGGIFVSAENIRLIARPDRHRGQTGFPMIASRSAARPEDLTMDHVDMPPCEHVWPDEIKSAFGKS